MSDTFFTSDTHFGHAAILTPEYNNRPFESVEAMDESLIEGWNQRVKPGDLVYHLGDFAFHKREKMLEILSRLNGRKFFVRGNHDKDFAKALKSVAGTSQAKGIDGFEWYKEIKINKQRIVLFHFPIHAWHRMNGGSWHLHGHSHGNLKDDGIRRRIDVGVDSVGRYLAPHFDYSPISLDEVGMVMASRDMVQVDHHGRDER